MQVKGGQLTTFINIFFCVLCSYFWVNYDFNKANNKYDIANNSIHVSESNSAYVPSFQNQNLHYKHAHSLFPPLQSFFPEFHSSALLQKKMWEEKITKAYHAEVSNYWRMCACDFCFLVAHIREVAAHNILLSRLDLLSED